MTGPRKSDDAPGDQPRRGGHRDGPGRRVTRPAGPGGARAGHPVVRAVRADPRDPAPRAGRGRRGSTWGRRTMTNSCTTAPRTRVRAKDVNTDPSAPCTPVAERTTRGDPSDVATGWVVLPQDALCLAGALPLTLSRTHISNYRLGRWFGESWASTVDQRVEVEDDRLNLVLADGTILSYPI